MHALKEVSMKVSSNRTFLAHWIDWLATDAPPRPAPATIVEYKRQVVAFARWMEVTHAVSFAPKSITSYRIEQYFETKLKNRVEYYLTAVFC